MNAKIKGFLAPVKKCIDFKKDDIFKSVREKLKKQGNGKELTPKENIKAVETTSKDNKNELHHLLPTNINIIFNEINKHFSQIDKEFENVRQELEKKAVNWREELKHQPQPVTKLIDSNLMANSPLDNVFFSNDKFEILIDARGYKPEDVKCTILTNTVEVIAQKEEVSGASKRVLSLTRNYQLPQNVQAENGCCYLSAEGILLITAPWLK